MSKRIRCRNCGETINEEDIMHYTEDTGERMSCCPYCFDNEWDTVSECRVCGKEADESEVYGGYCIHCLREAVTYDIALAYIKDRDYMTEFVLCDWFGAEGVVSQSVELALFCEETFRRLVANEKLIGGNKLLAMCREYCVPGCPTYTADDEMFADWLGDYIKKQKNTKGGRIK